MQFGGPRRPVGVILCVFLVSVLALSHSWGSPPASWAGRVLDGDGVTPRGGVVISLHGAEGKTPIRSAPTRPDGGFTIAAMPPGQYALAVETADGAFVSSDRLTMEPGVNPPMTLALRTDMINADLGAHDENAPDWTTYKVVVGTLIALIGIFAVIKIADEDTESLGTPFEPPIN